VRDAVVRSAGCGRGVIEGPHGDGGVEGVVADVALEGHAFGLSGEQPLEEGHGPVGVADA
jgi:hypothetical protein